MHRIRFRFLLLLSIIPLTSCSSDQSSYPKLIFESDEAGIAVKVWEIKRTIHDDQGFGVGDHMMNAVGSLPFVIKNMFNKADARLDINELDDTKKGYKIEVRTSDEIDVKTVINEVTAGWADALGLDVFYGNARYEIPVMTISDEVLLNQSLVSENNGVTSKSEIRRRTYEIEGNIEVLAGILVENESLEPIDLNQIESKSETKYLFKLDRSKGIEGIISQLKDNYGISLTTENRPVKLLKIK